ncbi:MAG TPA: hypothetical protein DE109_04105 [Aeromonas sp.]|nr:hypothetical protein [Aeromonas sp.]
MIELTESQYASLTLLERLPAAYTVAPALPTPITSAKPKSKRGRPPVGYDNRELVAYMANRQHVVPVGEPVLPDWLEDIISGALTWRESECDNTHKLSPYIMRATMTMLPTISTKAVMAIPTVKRKGKRRGKGISERAARYYVQAAVVACDLAVMHMKSDRWMPDMWDLEAEELDDGLLDGTLVASLALAA